MDRQSLIIAIIFPILIVVFIVVGFWYYTKIISNKYNNYLSKINDLLKEPYIDVLTTLRTIDFCLKKQEENIENNTIDFSTKSIELEEIELAKNRFADQSINIENKIRDIKKRSNELSTLLKNKKFKNAKKTIEQIEAIKKEIENITTTINLESSKYVNQEKELSERNYKNSLAARKIKDILKKWLKEYKANTNFILAIKKKIETFKEYENEIGNCLKDQRYGDGFKLINEYRLALLNICEFGNRLDGFVKIIFNDSKNYISQVEHVIEQFQIKWNSNLNYLNVEGYMVNAKKSILLAEESMNEFDYEQTKENINNFMKTLLDLNCLINNEMKAFNFINLKKQKEIDEFENDVSRKMIEINSDFEKCKSIDANYMKTIKPSIDQMEELISTIYQQKNKYENDLKSDKISNISKQHSYKTFLFLIKQFNELFYKTKMEIDYFYSQGFSQRLKYDRLSKIYLKTVSYIKNQAIKLSIKNKELIKTIEMKKNEITNLIIDEENDNEKRISQEVDNFYNLINEMCNSIVKKITIIKLFTIINENNAYLRIKDDEYNEKAIEAEHEFVEGKYFEALKILTNALNMEEN